MLKVTWRPLACAVSSCATQMVFAAAPASIMYAELEHGTGFTTEPETFTRTSPLEVTMTSSTSLSEAFAASADCVAPSARIVAVVNNANFFISVLQLKKVHIR